MRRLLLVFLLIPALAAAQERPRNVVLFIGDGFGPAFATMARQATGRPLALDGILAGSIGTASSTSEVTDSAAGATAYACALRTFDSAIAMDDARQPCRTILEAAEARGMATGLVATSRITHATPASFAAHVPDRDMEAEIAARMVKLGIEVLFGGGARFFTPEAIGGSRTDPHDLIEQARRAGVHVATSRAEYDALAAVPALALLADDHLAYELDRDETDEPSLAEMTRKALDLLKGFAIDTWWGLVAPAGTPVDVIQRLNQAFVAALNSPEAKTRFAALMAEPVATTPDEFAAFMRAELAKYEKVVKASGAKVD